jgi:hypothetical protein
MVFPPGQGKSGQHLMELWRTYLEQFADREGNIEAQIVVASYHAAEIFGFLSKALDREGKDRTLIDQRIGFFREGTQRADAFGDCLVTACFTLYNHMNTLCRQFAYGSTEPERIIRQVEEQVHTRTLSTDQIDRSAAALRAVFPLLSLMTLMMDQDGTMTQVIRQIEQRFATGASRASSPWEHLLNALYRTVEMTHLFVLLSDPELKDQVHQIATQFEEDDQTPDIQLKLRNGFCRLFELGHLVTTHLDEMLDPGRSA